MTENNINIPLKNQKIEAAQLLAVGMNLTKSAATVGIARQTLSEWKNHDTDFQAEIKRQREFLWNESILRIKNLAGKSIEVLDEGLQNNDFKIRLMCARTILALSGIAGATKETEKPIIFRDASRNFCSTCGQNKIKEIMSQFTL